MKIVPTVFERPPAAELVAYQYTYAHKVCWSLPNNSYVPPPYVALF